MESIPTSFLVKLTRKGVIYGLTLDIGQNTPDIRRK